MMSRILYLLIFSGILVLWIETVLSQEDDKKIEVYTVAGIAGRPTERIPASYVRGFAKWQITPGGQVLPVNTEEECDVEDTATKTETISLQPTINFMLRKGVPTYLFAGLGVNSNNNKKQGQTSAITLNNHHWAQQWTTFDHVASPNFHLQVLIGPGDGSTDRQLGLVEPKRLQDAVERLGVILATNEQKDIDFSEGYHILTIPLPMDTMEDWDMARAKGGIMRLTSIATAEQNANQLLSLDKSELEKTGTSILQVEAFHVLSSMV